MEVKATYNYNDFSYLISVADEEELTILIELLSEETLAYTRLEASILYNQIHIRTNKIINQKKFNRMEKKHLIKALRLQKYFDAYRNENRRSEIEEKFTQCWGAMLAQHFLSKYSTAEELIWALDTQNLRLFIERF